jgi:hypothetical protein
MTLEKGRRRLRKIAEIEGSSGPPLLLNKNTSVLPGGMCDKNEPIRFKPFDAKKFVTVVDGIAAGYEEPVGGDAARAGWAPPGDKADGDARQPALSHHLQFLGDGPAPMALRTRQNLGLRI